MAGDIDSETLKALASYTGTVQQCPPGVARRRIKRRTPMKGRMVQHADEQRGNYYRCQICRMWHINGFNYKRNEKLIEKEIKQHIEPSTWVWNTPPEEPQS
jgi:hypothetical protein